MAKKPETVKSGLRKKENMTENSKGLRAQLTKLLDGNKGALVPKGDACFPVRKDINTGKLRDDLCKDLDRIRAGAEEDPFSNSIMMLALDISRRLEKGTLSYSAIESLIQRLTANTFVLRAERMGDYLGELDPDKNDKLLRKVVMALAFSAEAGKKAKAKPVPFDKFKARVEQELLGIVFTAHPTFSITGDLMHDLVALATGRDSAGKPLTPARQKAIFKSAIESEHRPDKGLDLAQEHALSLEAIANLQAAMRRAYDVIFWVAEDIYPGQAKDLAPKLLSVASWVGYDIDGRSDINWTDTLYKRLRVQLFQLQHYLDSVRKIIAINKKPGTNRPLRKTLAKLESRLKLAINELSEEMKVFGAYEAKESSHDEQIRLIAKQMHEGRSRRLVESTELIDYINTAIVQCRENSIGAKRVHGLCVLRAELTNYGLGMARTHVRINASQLHNSIRKAIGMETSPDDPANVATYTKALNKLIGRTKPATINFGSILAEQMSGKRLFMIVAQMLKYVDATTPVRFLIAECETSFTLLAALYFAKLFGVEDKIDISPLFETDVALMRGHKVIEEVLENPHYREYVKNRRRLCVQTGFSDAGRYLGQVAATLSIENLHLNIGRVLARHGLEGVQLLIFDTHGESIGRGGHPVSLVDRLHYLASPYSRKKFEDSQLPFKEEISFQGGDGYQYFMNETASYAVVTRILETMLTSSDEAENDPFYEDADYAAEIVNTIKQFNCEVMDDPDYAALLGAFGTNMLYPSGSRPIKRQHEGGAGASLFAHPSQTRAIPQNAILQQFGMLANTLGGVGQVYRKNPEKFRTLYGSSPRFRRVMKMVEYAFAYSEVEVFKAYIDTFDPGRWLSRAGRTSNQARSDDMIKLAGILEEAGFHEKLVRIYRVFQKEYMEIRGWLLGQDCSGRLAVGRGRVIPKKIRDDLLLLHGIRLALIHELYLLSTRIPEFSLQTGVTREEILSRLLSLDVPETIEALESIFPPTVPKTISGDFGETATYRSEDIQSYAQEHERIFRPISNIYDCIRRIGTGITHFIGALG